MLKREKYWLIFLIGFSGLHIIRDIFQDLGVNNVLSTILVRPHQKFYYDIYWWIFNTYAIAITEIILSLSCLLRNKFDKIGRLTIIIAIIAILV